MNVLASLRCAPATVAIAWGFKDRVFERMLIWVANSDFERVVYLDGVSAFG